MSELPSRPLLAPWYRVIGDGERLLLEYAQSLVVLEGAAVSTLLPALLPLLDGRHDVDALAVRLGEAARPAIESALELLASHGILVAGPNAPAEMRPQAYAVAAACGIPPAVADERLRGTTVGFAGRGRMAADVSRLLYEAGLRELRRVGWSGRTKVDLVVVVPAADEYDRLPAWNGSALHKQQRWLLVRQYDGRFASVGPLVVPQQTCCYECLLLRRGANAGYPGELAEVEGSPLAAPREAAVDAITAAVAAHLVLRLAVGDDRTLPGTLHALETRPALRLSEHAVLRVPRCPACSVAARIAPPLPWHQAAA